MSKMKVYEIEKIAKNRNCYRELDLKDYSSLKDIKKKYRELAKKYHPDKLVNKELAISKIEYDKFSQITEAYEILSKNKDLYDSVLRRPKSVPKEKQEFIPDSKTFKEHLLKYELYMIHRQFYINKYVSDNDACKFMIFNVIVGGISFLYLSFFTVLLSPILFDALFRLIQIWSEFPIKRAGLIEFLFSRVGV